MNAISPKHRHFVMEDPVDAVPEAGLYIGRVMHQRLKPFSHRLDYGVFHSFLMLTTWREQLRVCEPLPITGGVFFRFMTKIMGQVMGYLFGLGLRPAWQAVVLFWMEAR